MYRMLLALAASQVLLVGSVRADAWDAYFNMATFGAGGGTDAGGWFNFECAAKDSGFSTADQAIFTLLMGEEFTRDGFVPEKDILFRVGDGLSFTLPMSLHAESAVDLYYDYSVETQPDVLGLVKALRRGSQVSAWSGEQQLARVSLDGSNAALEGVEACVAGED